MSERIITLDSVEPIDIYGPNDSHLNLIRSYFPKIKIVARGFSIKLLGNDDEVELFEKKFNLLIEHYHKHGHINTGAIERLMGIAGDNLIESKEDANNDILLFGNNGLVIKARTPNQKKLVESVKNHDMVFAIGPAGSGKTYTAVTLAVRALKNKEVRKIILTRPAVEAGENLGFLPGDLKEKLDPYMQPLYDALYDMIPPDKLEQFILNKVIQIAPLAFMRGRTLDNAFVILDEAQNATESQMKMFLTRMGASAKFVITGDISQIDLPRQQPSGLVQATKILENTDGIGFVYLDNKDVIRHNIVKRVLERYDAVQKQTTGFKTN